MAAATFHTLILCSNYFPKQTVYSHAASLPCKGVSYPFSPTCNASLDPSCWSHWKIEESGQHLSLQVREYSNITDRAACQASGLETRMDKRYPCKCVLFPPPPQGILANAAASA